MINLFHILRSAVIALVLALSTGAGSAATHDVTTGEAFAEAFRTAAPGDRIVLAPGDYRGVRLKGGGGAPDRPVTILSQDATDPARFSALKLNNVSHVVLEGLFLDYTFKPGDKLRAKPFVVESSRDVTLRNLVIDGDEAHDLNATSDGLPAGFGLAVARDRKSVV